ncbi:MAG: flagellar biosynthesis protein FlhA [Rubrivivax sp.]|nr:flagellar biosynthesis protein FlhA [Rubrivivax sp.]
MAKAATLPAATTGLARHTDVLLAGLVVAVIVMMALPLPAWSLDALVALNIAIGVLILLVALFIPSPLAFSTFPTVLLITTLFRISLNVATTRQILLNGHAGDIITAFGRLVVGGSLVVGIVVFLIITIVQFIVIAKGAERVAEVGARFTLDALPGKQMSIDADVRAGVITQAEAVQRRSDLLKESQFYGAMDGAMKFVKGDAIAGIVIVLVNLLGGIAIGTLVMDLGFGAAVQKFSILSIGDGLVTQIPALFLSIAAGVAITRTESDNSAHLGEQISRQLGAQPQALMLAAAVMLLFAFVPGFPALVFVVLGGSAALLAFLLKRGAKAQARQQSAIEVPAGAREGEQQPALLQAARAAGRPPSAFRLDISDTLAERIGAVELDSALSTERSRLREDYGIPFPGIALQTTAALPEQAFALSVQDLVDLTLTVPPAAVLAIGPAAAMSQGGFNPLDVPAPELLQPARWLPAAEADRAAAAGLEVLSPARVVARTVMAVIQKNPASALGVQEVRQLVREIEWRFPDLVREVQAVIPLPRIADLMAALARERVPLTDFAGLLQSLVTNGVSAADTHAIYEGARLALARGIVARLLRPGDAKLPVVALEPELENRLRAALVTKPDGPVLGMAPDAIEALAKSVQSALLAAADRGRAVLLLAPDIRRATSRLLRGQMPNTAFVSLDELAASGVAAEVVGKASTAA